MRSAALLVAITAVLAGCSQVSVDCGSFSSWEACPIEEGCGWGHVDREWRCVSPCESDDDCDAGTCQRVGGGADSDTAGVSFEACVE